MLSIIVPHGEPGFTNEMKDRISLAGYVMARMLMPEKIGRKYMTAPARYYSETQIINSRIGEPFADANKRESRTYDSVYYLRREKTTKNTLNITFFW